MHIKRIYESLKDPITTHYSSNCSELPEVSLTNDLNMIILLEDVLLIKGNINSKFFGREQSLDCLERSKYIHHLMHLHGTRKDRLIHYIKQTFPEEIHKETTFLDLIKQKRKKKVILREKEYIKNREERFNERLKALLKMESEPRLFKGKIILSRNAKGQYFARRADYVSICLGKISERAIKKIFESSFPANGQFDAIEELLPKRKTFSGGLRWTIDSDKRIVRIIIENCRY